MKRQREETHYVLDHQLYRLLSSSESRMVKNKQIEPGEKIFIDPKSGYKRMDIEARFVALLDILDTRVDNNRCIFDLNRSQIF